MVKYNSITNHYNSDFITKALEKIRERKILGTEVAITEKVDGSNIGIRVENGTFSVQSRNQVLDDNAVFGNFQEVIMRNGLRDKLLEITSKHFGPQPVIFFGELIGGQYGKQKGGIPVQKRINYCPKNEILFFDIAVIKKVSKTNADGEGAKNTENITESEISEKLEYLSYFDFAKFCDIWGLPQVPLLKIIDLGDFESSLKEALQMSPDFETRVPAEIRHCVDFRIIENHTYEAMKETEDKAEGFVIRPYRYDFMVSDCDRFIIKVKSEKFGEKNVVAVQQIADSINIKPYLNENRIASALSKYPQNANYGTIISEVFADAYTDYEADSKTTLDADSRKLLQKRHSSQVFTMLKSILQK